MPGVVVSTQTQVGPATALRAQSGQFFVTGLTERGSVTAPILVRGMADVEALLGERVSYGSVWDCLKSFFDEGGEQAYVARVVGPAATVGTLTLVDRAGSPVNTVRVDAASPGSWSSQLKVRVVNGSVADTYRITVYLNDEVVQDVNNIATPAAAVTSFAESQYIRCTDLGSATAAPNNNPATLTATALSAGTDDRASVVAAGYVSALALFLASLGDGSVAIPGQTGTTIFEGIRDHCEANNRIGLLSGALGADKAALLALVPGIDSEWCGLFAPWIKVPDGLGSTRTISPEGYVAAVRARAHGITGPWRVPAGQIAQANTVSDVYTRFSESDADDLDAGRVSIIRIVANTVRLYGWRSMSSDEAEYWFLHNRDLLNNLVVESEKLLEQYVFQPIDSKGHLQAAMNGTLTGLVKPIADKGGLYARIDQTTGQQIDPGFKVETGSSVNTPASLAQNEVRARLLVRISPVGGLIDLTIVKVGILAGM